MRGQGQAVTKHGQGRGAEPTSGIARLHHKAFDISTIVGAGQFVSSVNDEHHKKYGLNQITRTKKSKIEGGVELEERVEPERAQQIKHNDESMVLSLDSNAEESQR